MSGDYVKVEDGWKDAVKPSFVSVESDYFYPDTINLVLSFDFGNGFEKPKAKLPILYCADHMIASFENGRKTGEHRATEKEQRDAFSLLARLFPEWSKFCKGNHTTEEKLYWFENDGIDSVRNTRMDIKVRHSESGFCNASVKDPANAKERKPREHVTKSAAITRANAAFSAIFGGAAEPAAKIRSEDDMPF